MARLSGRWLSAMFSPVVTGSNPNSRCAMSNAYTMKHHFIYGFTEYTTLELIISFLISTAFKKTYLSVIQSHLVWIQSVHVTRKRKRRSMKVKCARRIDWVQVWASQEFGSVLMNESTERKTWAPWRQQVSDLDEWPIAFELSLEPLDELVTVPEAL